MSDNEDTTDGDESETPPKEDEQETPPQLKSIPGDKTAEEDAADKAQHPDEALVNEAIAKVSTLKTTEPVTRKNLLQVVDVLIANVSEMERKGARVTELEEACTAAIKRLSIGL